MPSLTTVCLVLIVASSAAINGWYAYNFGTFHVGALCVDGMFLAVAAACAERIKAAAIPAVATHFGSQRDIPRGIAALFVAIVLTAYSAVAILGFVADARASRDAHQVSELPGYAPLAAALSDARTRLTQLTTTHSDALPAPSVVEAQIAALKSDMSENARRCGATSKKPAVKAVREACAKLGALEVTLSAAKAQASAEADIADRQARLEAFVADHAYSRQTHTVAALFGVSPDRAEQWIALALPVLMETLTLLGYYTLGMPRVPAVPVAHPLAEPEAAPVPSVTVPRPLLPVRQIQLTPELQWLIDKLLKANGNTVELTTSELRAAWPSVTRQTVHNWLRQWAEAGIIVVDKRANVWAIRAGQNIAKLMPGPQIT